MRSSVYTHESSPVSGWSLADLIFEIRVALNSPSLPPLRNIKEPGADKQIRSKFASEAPQFRREIATRAPGKSANLPQSFH